MTTVTRRVNPVAEMLNWLEGEPSTAMRGFGLSPYIRVEDYVEDGVYVLRAEMPGIDPDKDVEVSVEGDVLTIKGERQEEEKEKNRHEFHYGSFSRSLTLPRGTKVDDISASYADGVLELRVPMEGEKSEARTIPVQRTKE
jgi:HSP20 family molecular chaperone IbpA